MEMTDNISGPSVCDWFTMTPDLLAVLNNMPD